MISPISPQRKKKKEVKLLALLGVAVLLLGLSGRLNKLNQTLHNQGEPVDVQGIESKVSKHANNAIAERLLLRGDTLDQTIRHEKEDHEDGHVHNPRQEKGDGHEKSGDLVDHLILMPQREEPPRVHKWSGKLGQVCARRPDDNQGCSHHQRVVDDASNKHVMTESSRSSSDGLDAVDYEAGIVQKIADSEPEGRAAQPLILELAPLVRGGLAKYCDGDGCRHSDRVDV
mmetsp:Transcript_414/g.1413  ORF Transcript_414/g.1413 Transcript_414/m.1413 type:complete len:229 (+) Transcript_414:704-1390(+)